MKKEIQVSKKEAEMILRKSIEASQNKDSVRDDLMKMVFRTAFYNLTKKQTRVLIEAFEIIYIQEKLLEGKVK